MNLHAVQFLEQAVGTYIYIYICVKHNTMRRLVSRTGNIGVHVCIYYVCVYMQARFNLLLNTVRRLDVHAQDITGRAAVHGT